MLERCGRLPARVIACVGGGSNAIGMFTPFTGDAGVELVGVEAAGEGLASGRHGAPLTVGGRGGVLQGAYSAIMQDEDGQITEAHSISAGLDYPGVGPRARLAARLRAGALRGGDRRARRSRPSAGVAELEGIIPALESAHAIAWVLANPRAPDGAAARPRLPLRPRRQGPRRGPGAHRRDRGAASRPPGTDVIAAAFAGVGQARGADALPDGRLPRRSPTRARSARPTRRPAPTCVELGVPFSDPLADGPVIHAAGTAALAAGATLHDVLEVGAAARRVRPGGAHVLREPHLRARAGALRRRARRARDQRPDRARPAAGGGGADARGVRRGRASRSSRSWRRRRRTIASRRSAPRARGFVYTVSVTGTTGERGGLDGGLRRDPRAHAGPHRRCRSRSASASARRRPAAGAADAGRRRRDRRLAARPGGGRGRRSRRRGARPRGGVRRRAPLASRAHGAPPRP